MPFLDNAKTSAPETTVGFKISKPGYDATRTAGSNYVFNSSWPSLPIAFEQSGVNAGPGTLAIPHGLGYAPFSMAWYYGTDASGIANRATRSIPDVDATNVYVAAGTYNVKCFRLNLAEDIDYTLAPGDTFNLPYDPDYGVKVVKPNKNINSRDMRDFTLHSRCQSPLILAVKTERTMNPANLTATDGTIQYTTDLNYPAWVYGFTKTAAGLYVYAPYYSQAYPSTVTDGIVSSVTYSITATDIGATLVVLRDPMFAANQVTVQY